MKKSSKLFPSPVRRWAETFLVATAGWCAAASLAQANSLVWTGANGSEWDTGTFNWALSGGGAAVYANGDAVLFNDSAVNTGVSLNQAVSPASIVVSNNNFNYVLDGTGYLTGSGSLTKRGTGQLTLNNTGANDFTGGVTVSAGILVAGSGSALGSTNAVTTVANGAQLQIINNATFLAGPITVSGSGPDGSGAIFNNSGNTIPSSGAENFSHLTLAGDTTIGVNGRMNIGWGSADPSQSTLSTGGHAYKLIYTGTSSSALVINAVTVDPALGDVEVHSGYFNLQSTLPGLGDPNYALRIWPSAQLYFFQLSNQLEKVVVLESDGYTPSLQVGGNSVAKIGGKVVLANDCVINVNTGSELDLNGGLGGGMLTQQTPGKLVLNGTMTNANTVAAAGTLTLNGTHTGTITINAGAVFNGTGTNYGLSDVMGAVLPGGTNQAGTLTLGGLTLEWGATLSVELGANNIVGAGINDLLQVNGDLTVNGNAVAINPQGLLLTGPTHPYRLANYTGNLIWNGDLVVTGPNGYTFAVDTSTAGQINLIVSGGPVVWNGGSATDSNWSDAANWNGNGPVPGAILNFSGTTRLNNTNDTTEGTSYGTLDFLSGAGGFSLNGNSLTLGGNVVNHSSALQTFNLGLLFSSNLTLDGGTGGLFINGGLTNTLGSPGATVVSLAGEGTLDNRITGANSPGGTNTIHVLTNANWTLLDNPSHTAVTLPLSLAVNGTFHFGSSNSAPVVTATPVGLAGISGLSYDTVGNVAGATGTLNIEGGNLMLPNNGRLYVANGANARGILNVSGGALNLRGGLQAANGNAVNQVAVVNVSGGLLNMGTTNTGTQQSIYLAATGTGTLNLSGAGVVSCVTLDVSGNQHGNTIGSVGTVNLDGGTLIPTTVTTASASPQSGLANGTSATFNFNGGTLRARGTAATVFRGNLSNPTLPITSIVKTGGAVLDSANYSLLMYEPLQHDASLASALDGGLKKLGTGRVELHQPSTYTGPTVILAGTLALTEAGTVMDSALIFVTNNAVLDVSGLNAGFTLTGGQVLAGRGRVGGDVVVADGATLVPGVANAQLSFTNGTLMFSNSLTLQDGSVTIMGLNGGLNPSNTTAQVNATLTYGGSLVISNFSNTAFQIGDTFKLFAASAYSGAFTNIVYPSGYTWTNSLDTDGSVTVLTVAPPLPTTPTNVSFSISSGLLHLAWPTEYRGWILQVQTNDLQHGLGTSWVTVPGSDAVNATDIPVNPAAGAVFYRLAYPQ